MDSVKNFIASSRRIVIKIGSALLVHPRTGKVRTEWLEALIDDVAWLSAKGSYPLIVSSGSVALGRALLQLKSGPLPLEQSQAAAAVGQIRLAQAYEQVLEVHGALAAQILLTLDDSRNRRRYLNSRATFESLLSQRVIPIVNENDTVATDDIRFGDNDRLAAQVAAMTNSDCMILLSDIDGLYSANPRVDTSARHIAMVPVVTTEIEVMASGAGSANSKGGMKTKLQAAKTAASAGCATIIANGKVNSPLSALMDGAKSTLFLPQGDPQSARKHWIASMKPFGRIFADDGALSALSCGKSLLPAGVFRIDGEFDRGDPVEICGKDESTVGIGLARYTSSEATRILGKRSAEVSQSLGYPARAALVHRDDLTSLTFGRSPSPISQ